MRVLMIIIGLHVIPHLNLIHVLIPHFLFNPCHVIDVYFRKTTRSVPWCMRRRSWPVRCGSWNWSWRNWGRLCMTDNKGLSLDQLRTTTIWRTMIQTVLECYRGGSVSENQHRDKVHVQCIIQVTVDHNIFTARRFSWIGETREHFVPTKKIVIYSSIEI